MITEYRIMAQNTENVSTAMTPIGSDAETFKCGLSNNILIMFDEL